MKKIALLFTCLLSVLLLHAQDYTQLYLIGGATPNGWDRDKSIQMNKINGTEASFTWTGSLKAEDFKFINNTNDFMPSFNASKADEAIELGQEYELIYNETDYNIDYKFKLANAGVYTVNVDLKTLKMTVTEGETLWIIGGATPYEWDNQKALQMTKVANSETTFTWTGLLKAGDFKFIKELGTYQPGYNATTENEKVILGQPHTLAYTESNENDFKFILEHAGKYTVNVDLSTLKMTVTLVESFSETLWITGSAIPNGATQLSVHPSGIFSTLYYTGELKQGILKFSTSSQDGTDTQYYIPIEEDIDILDASNMQITKDANAPGWNVAVADSYYKIIVNLADKTIKAIRVSASQELYLVGGATEAGWSTEKAIAFVKDEHNPNLFSIETELKIREEFVESNAFKILFQKDWGPNSLHPYTIGEPILNSKTFVENGDDTKWTIDPSQQGRYRIIINLMEETMKASFLNETDINRRTENNNEVIVIPHEGFVSLASALTITSAQLTTLSGNLIDVKTGDKSIRLGNNLHTGVYIVTVQVGNKNLRQKVYVR